MTVTYPALVPINPAAFGYCQGWVLLDHEAGKLVCLQTFGQHQYSDACKTIERLREMKHAG